MMCSNRLGGTTGDPKGVVHTHANVLASLRPIETDMDKYLKYEKLVHPIRILHTLPLSHVFGQFMGLWIPVLLSAELHFESRLVAAELVDYIRQHRISVLAAVPRVLDLLDSYVVASSTNLLARLHSAAKVGALGRWWRFRDVHRLFGLKFWAFVSGGAALSAEAEQFWNGLGFAVIQGYGMTETTALVSLNHPFKLARGTVGQVLPGREVRLAADGEVLVKGETISNATWQGGRLQQNASEWLATGDLAEFDPEGNLRFRGRKKDVIVTSSGLNIHPEDLEAALNHQPEVKAAAVVEHATEYGPEPLAALVLRNGSREASEIVAAANSELADFQRITRWIVWPDPDLPRTSTGKILRREVSRRILNGEAGTDTGAALAKEAEHLDSLGRVQLQAQLEQQLGVALDDAALQNVHSSEDVRNLIASASTLTEVSKPKSLEHAYPHWPWNPVVQCIRAVFLELIAMPLVRLLAKPKVRRAKVEWPSDPLLIVANHVTAYDVAFMLYALPGKIRRRVAVAMAGELLLDWRRARNQGNWFLNVVAPLEYLVVTALFNVFPLPQFSGFRRSFRHAGEAMDRGYNVIVFPEGRRADNEQFLPFKTGAGLLWKELGTAALTMRLVGLGDIKEQRKRWFRAGNITIFAGRILPLPADGDPEALTERLRAGIIEASTFDTVPADGTQQVSSDRPEEGAAKNAHS
jgi:long-chain acyl-CoA synthetase